MEPTIKDLQAELQKQREILERILISTEKTRKYFFWTFVATVIVVVLPLIVLPFILPSFLSTYTNSL